MGGCGSGLRCIGRAGGWGPRIGAAGGYCKLGGRSIDRIVHQSNCITMAHRDVIFTADFPFKGLILLLLKLIGLLPFNECRALYFLEHRKGKITQKGRNGQA